MSCFPLFAFYLNSFLKLGQKGEPTPSSS
ncbi:hypothetical protein MCP1_1940001 [Candidatus Terasakiella magnetica]|nr:hypothetical protein MCP1_1940001 [Candidatus Terasakiella magnetica]